MLLLDYTLAGRCGLALATPARRHMTLAVRSAGPRPALRCTPTDGCSLACCRAFLRDYLQPDDHPGRYPWLLFELRTQVRVARSCGQHAGSEHTAHVFFAFLGGGGWPPPWGCCAASGRFRGASGCAQLIPYLERVAACARGGHRLPPRRSGAIRRHMVAADVGHAEGRETPAAAPFSPARRPSKATSRPASPAARGTPTPRCSGAPRCALSARARRPGWPAREHPPSLTLPPRLKRGSDAARRPQALHAHQVRAPDTRRHDRRRLAGRWGRLAGRWGRLAGGGWRDMSASLSILCVSGLYEAWVTRLCDL